MKIAQGKFLPSSALLLLTSSNFAIRLSVLLNEAMFLVFHHDWISKLFLKGHLFIFPNSPALCFLMRILVRKQNEFHVDFFLFVNLRGVQLSSVN